MTDIPKISDRMITWFKNNQPEYIKGINSKGATTKEIQDFEEKTGHPLPESFKDFYKEHNGWKYCFIEFIESFQSLDDILGTMSVLGDFSEYDNYIPFTISSRARDHYCLNMNSSGEVVFLSTDDDEIETVAPTFEEWLEQLVTDLEKGNYDEYFRELEE